MKRTLLHSLPAFEALMEWYPLRNPVRSFLGERLTHLFAHAVSTETDCLICSTFFRRLLIESGENADPLMLSDRERVVLDFGRKLGKTRMGVIGGDVRELSGCSPRSRSWRSPPSA
jgi:hypothetical protein